MHPHLLVHALDVRRDGVGGDAEGVGDFLVAQALGEQVEDLGFARGEVGRQVAGAGGGGGAGEVQGAGGGWPGCAGGAARGGRCRG